jgi:MFS family permease
MAVTEQSPSNAAPEEFKASSTYSYYVVWLLFIVYVFNFVDRQILSIVLEQLKNEFKFEDWQLGLLHGTAFAIFYATLGIPIARVADSRSRVNIIAISIVIWSFFTAITAGARNFWHLFIARIGVGVGEAGCSPPAYSLIADYFEPKKRATALSIYSMGVYGGSALGYIIGGNVASVYGWRTAFLVVGIPGILIALLLKFTVREPPRGYSEPNYVAAPPPPFMTVLRRLWSRPSFRHLSVAAGLHAFVSYGVSGFYAPFFIRSHGMGQAELGNWLGFIVAAGGLAGTYFGGAMSDRLFSRKPDPRYYLWVPAATLFIVAPFGLFVYGVDSKYVALWSLVPYVALIAAYLAPSIATTHRLVGLRERALAGAVLLLVLNLIGLGLGPLFTGSLSTYFEGRFIADGLSAPQAAADGLRYAIYVTVLINIWAGTHYLLAAKTLNQDIKTGEQEQVDDATARATAKGA